LSPKAVIRDVKRKGNRTSPVKKPGDYIWGSSGAKTAKLDWPKAVDRGMQLE
jgi:hypothetical protein